MKTLLKLTVVSFVLAVSANADLSTNHASKAAPLSGTALQGTPVESSTERGAAQAASPNIIGNFNADVDACVRQRVGENKDSLDTAAMMEFIKRAIKN